jgi:DNA-binding transcriptional ArsR family regulator
MKIMRPLFHPSLEDVTVEAILHALSDPVRVAIFADIAASECSQTCSNFVNFSERPIPKSTLSQHFKALREAGLIRGVEQRFPGLIAAIVNAHNVQSQQKPPAAAGTRRKPANRNSKSKPRKSPPQRS